jgi:hypothetical protein
MCSSVSMPTLPSAIREAELRLEDLVEVVRGEAHEAGGLHRRAARDDVALGEGGHALTVDRQRRGRKPATSMSTVSDGSSTSVRSNSMWGETGVSNMARCFGDTTGPRADNEYAVEPVGVATISPSAA